MARIVHIYPIRDYALETRTARRIELVDTVGFLEAVRYAIQGGKLALSPGHYLMQELVENSKLDTRRGIIFSVNSQGEVLRGFMGRGVTPNASTWPPKNVDQSSL